jgi:hypothetical protein
VPSVAILSSSGGSIPIRVLDEQNGGAHRVTGTARDGVGVPGRHRVRLFARRDGAKVSETWSDAATGHYAFEWIRYAHEGYLISVHGHGGAPENASVLDLVTPEPMP